MLGAVLPFAVEKLGDFAIQTAECRLSFTDDVGWLKTEFQHMQSFLKVAERNQRADPRVQQFVREITDLAREILDTLEEFNSKIGGGSGESSSHGIVDRVKSFAWVGNKEAILYYIGNKIKSIKERVSDLYRRRKSYGIPNISEAGEGSSSNGPDNGSSLRQLRRSTPYADDELFVGFEDVTKTLSEELLKDEARRSFISIYGMGGLGKTTLARRLYNSIDVQKGFSCRAWVCVSQDYSIQELFRTIIKSFKKVSNREELEMLDKMNEVDLEGYLREFLENKKYLVVVDDVWNKEAWQSLKRAFPDCRNGSRVIVTTRNKEVAERVDDRGFVHRLRFLTTNKSWDLFKKKISRGAEHTPHWFSPVMQEIGKEMVEKCRGLPLAINVLGGLLSTKREPQYWYKVKEHLWQHMKNDSVEISQLFSLSYDALSDEVKACFLYVSVFPEDHEFSSRRLIQMWIAEGFIQGNNLEDDAECLLNELIDRSLVQVAERSWRGIEKCRIHDLVRDLAIVKAREVDLFDIYDPRIDKGRPSYNQSRLVIHSNVKQEFSNDLYPANLKSLMLFNSELSKEMLETVCEKFPNLHVLNLEGTFLDGPCKLPDSIWDMTNLRHLRIEVNNVSELTPGIGKLNMLQSLDLQSAARHSRRLPMDISGLFNLRHLNLYNCEGNFSLDALTNLRTLKGDVWSLDEY